MTFICYDRCTTCQKARKWLDGQGLAYEVRPIKEENPTREEILRWQAISGLPMRKFFNTSGLKYKELGLKDRLPRMTEDEMADLLSTDGMLVKRPLLIGEDLVLAGFREKEWQERLGR